MTPLGRAKVAMLRLAAGELRAARLESRWATCSGGVRDRVHDGRAWAALERADGYLEMARAVVDAEDVLLYQVHAYHRGAAACVDCSGHVHGGGHHRACRMPRLVGRGKAR